MEIKPELLDDWYKSLERWNLVQTSEFFIDPETGQVGAVCIGPDPGSIEYFRPL